MDTNIRNLQLALAYWQGQALLLKKEGNFVIAQRTGLRVVTDEATVMLAGCCNPFLFFTKTAAANVAAEVKASGPMDFDGEPELEVMTEREFCNIQIKRFSEALQTIRVADAMARDKVAA